MEVVVNNVEERVNDLVPQDCSLAQHVVVGMGLC